MGEQGGSEVGGTDGERAVKVKAFLGRIDYFGSCIYLVENSEAI